MVSTLGRGWKIILTKPNNLINYTSSIWFQDIIDFIYKHNISIVTKDFISTKGQRQNDKCIMKEILKLHLPKISLIQINSCRIYLNISHLSDMLDPNGKQIEHNYMIGTKSTKQHSTFKWPHQLKLSKTAWKLWELSSNSPLTISSPLNYNSPNGPSPLMKDKYNIDGTSHSNQMRYITEPNKAFTNFLFKAKTTIDMK